MGEALKVRCQACRTYVTKDENLRRSGLGWVCQWCQEKGVARGVALSRNAQQKRTSNHARASARAQGPDTATRQRVLARDNRRCRLCQVEANHLHHIYYRSQGGPNVDHNLITLCPKCHPFIHSDKRRWQPICLAYIWLRYVEGRKLTLAEVERIVMPR